MMWKRLRCTGLILFLLAAACSSKSDPASVSPTDRYVESVNSVSGSFTVDGVFNYDKKPYTINVTEAYGRVVKNRADQTKQDVLVLLLEKPLSRFALAVAENDDVEVAAGELDDVLHSRDARGVVFRVAVDRKAAAETEEKIRQLNESGAEFNEIEVRRTGDSKVRPYFNGNDFDFGNLVLDIKSVSTDEVEGHIKSNVSSQHFDITFSVRLEPNVWTGGKFYEQPPTKLSAGQARGQFEIDGRAVKLNHAYARLVELDLFDETKNVFKVWLTENPVDAKALFDDSANNLLAMKQSGNNVVFTYNTTGPADRSEPNIWRLSQLPVGVSNQSLRVSSDVFDHIPGIERDYVRYDKDAIEGRLFSSFPIHEEDRIYKVDLLFNAAMLPPAVSDGPVTAGNGGEALPSDGGAPAKAYFAAIERMNSAKGFDDKLAVWLTVVQSGNAEKIRQDLESLSPQQRQLFLEVFAPLDELQLTGGFIKDNKATLRFTGKGREGTATEVVNMHLEDGQWKIGRREIRE